MDRGNLTPLTLNGISARLLLQIILNDKRIQRLLKKRARFIRVCSFKLPDKQSKIFYRFMRRMKKKKGIEVFLKEAYREIKDNKSLFKI